MSFEFQQVEGGHIKVIASHDGRRQLGTMEGIGEVHRGINLNEEFSDETFVGCGLYMLVSLQFTGGSYEAVFMYVATLQAPHMMAETIDEIRDLFDEERCDECGQIVDDCSCNLQSVHDGVCLQCRRPIHLIRGCLACEGEFTSTSSLSASSSSTDQNRPGQMCGGCLNHPLQCSCEVPVCPVCGGDYRRCSHAVPEFEEESSSSSIGSNQAVSQEFVLPPAPTRQQPSITGVPPEEREFDIPE